MQAIYNKVTSYVDDYFHHSIVGVSNSIKSGLNFNNIYNLPNSPTGNLIDYNVRILLYNGTTLAAIVHLALLALGINLVLNVVFVGALFLLRNQIKQKIKEFWNQRAANVAIDTSVDFANKASKLYKWVPLVGKDWGLFGLFKTVTPIHELAVEIRSEAHLNLDSDEEFNNRMKNLPPITGLFLTLLKINAYFQG